MPGRRRGLTAVTLTCSALAVLVAYLAAVAVHPAKSAGGTRHSAITRSVVARKPSRTRRDSAIVSRQEQFRKARASSAARRTTRYGIAFFGDSVSVGDGASSPVRGYVARVSKWLRRHHKQVVATVKARGGVPVAYWEHTPVPTKLDAAVIELGTNDVRLWTPSARFAHEYRTLTGRIRATNPKAHVLCLSVWPRRNGTSLEGAINAQIRAACPGTYVNITWLRKRWGIRSSDAFHPNDAGYRLIAQEVESKLNTR